MYVHVSEGLKYHSEFAKFLRTQTKPIARTKGKNSIKKQFSLMNGVNSFIPQIRQRKDFRISNLEF